MKKFKKAIVAVICVLAVMAIMTVCLTACSGAHGDEPNSWDSDMQPSYSPSIGSTKPYNPNENYTYDEVFESNFENTQDKPTSYFSLDKNTACYSLVRNQLNYNKRVSPNSVRVEELINYFDYPLASPEEGKALGVSVSLMDCPWNTENKLMMAGVKTDAVNIETVNGNYVFLMDISGSMAGGTRLGLAKTCINTLVDNLGDRDVISLVTYATETNTVINGIECAEANKQEIKDKVSGLYAGGTTNGQGGLEKAYEIAAQHFIEGGNNRIILISDGDFNVGYSDTTAMKELIQTKAKSGVYLSVFGVGMGNTRDDMLETLARYGNGNYGYLDNSEEAQKVFTDGLKGNLFTVAKDAKAAVTFNADKVEKYRLIGYDTKMMSEDEFNNQDADAGEIGSGLCVIALYEVTLNAEATGDFATVEVRYKDVRETETPDSVTATVSTETESGYDIEFAACVAEFGLILRNSEYKGSADYETLLKRLRDQGIHKSENADRKEFYDLVYLAYISQVPYID